MESIIYSSQINLISEESIFDARNKVHNIATLFNLDLVITTYLTSEVSELCRWLKQVGECERTEPERNAGGELQSGSLESEGKDRGGKPDAEGIDDPRPDSDESCV